MRATKLLAGIPVAAATLVLSAAPAFATTYGSGSHNGSTSQTNTKLSTGCFQTVGSYAGSGPTSGSTSVSVTDGTHTYTGNVTVSWSYDFYQTFAGSTTDSTCATLGTGALGSASSGVLESSGDGGAGLSCTWTDDTYYRNGTGTSALTIDFPSSQGGCSVHGDLTVPMHWTNSGGFYQNSGGTGPSCTGGTSTSPPTSCDELFTFTLTS